MSCGHDPVFVNKSSSTKSFSVNQNVNLTQTMFDQNLTWTGTPAICFIQRYGNKIFFPLINELNSARISRIPCM